MKYEVRQSKGLQDDWRVEAITDPPEGDGEIFVAIFSGPRAEQRAREYAAWKSEHAHGERAA